MGSWGTRRDRRRPWTAPRSITRQAPENPPAEQTTNIERAGLRPRWVWAGFVVFPGGVRPSGTTTGAMPPRLRHQRAGWRFELRVASWSKSARVTSSASPHLIHRESVAPDGGAGVKVVAVSAPVLHRYRRPWFSAATMTAVVRRTPGRHARLRLFTQTATWLRLARPSLVRMCCTWFLGGLAPIPPAARRSHGWSTPGPPALPPPARVRPSRTATTPSRSRHAKLGPNGSTDGAAATPLPGRPHVGCPTRRSRPGWFTGACQACAQEAWRWPTSAPIDAPSWATMLSRSQTASHSTILPLATRK